MSSATRIERVDDRDLVVQDDWNDDELGFLRRSLDDVDRRIRAPTASTLKRTDVVRAPTFRSD